MATRKVKALFVRERVISETSAAKEFYDQGRFGSILEDNKVQLSLLEALYLMGQLQEGFLNNSSEAKKYYKRALDVNPQNEGVRSRLEGL